MIKKVIYIILVLATILAGVLAYDFFVNTSVSDVRVKDGSGDCVVLIHGLGWTLDLMKGLESSFNTQGYKTVNISYPSTHFGIADISNKFIAPAVRKNCAADKRINFVTHSLGGLVTRYYLAHNNLPNLGRVVMIAPPNGGSEIANFLNRFDLAKKLVGPTLVELVTSNPDLPQKLSAPNYEVGVMAGEFFNPFFSPFIPGADDGTVAVEKTKFDGMRGFAVVHSQHSLITGSEEAIAKALNFIEQGEFE